MLDVVSAMGDGIEHRHEIGALLGRAVDRAVGVDARIAFVAGDRVVEIVLLAPPFPAGDDDIAFDALRPRRLLEGQLAAGNAVGPVGEKRERLLRAEAPERHRHVLHCLTRLHAPCPGIRRVLEVAEILGKRAHALGAQRMAGLAGVLERVDPVVLILHDFGDAVALITAAGELALVGNLEERIPVHAGVVFRGRGLTRRRHRRQIDPLARRAFDLRRVDETVSAHPQAIVRLGKIGNDITALIIGDDDLGEFGGKLRCLGDHPDTGLGPLGSADDAAQIAGGDGDRAALLRDRRRHQQRGARGRH